MSYLHAEGTLPHQGIYDESKKAAADFSTMLNLALAYRLTANEKYLTAVEKYFNTWLDNYVLSFRHC